MCATFPIRDFPLFTFRRLPDQPPNRSLSEERLFDGAPLTTSEGAESPLLRSLMTDPFECLIQPGAAHVPVRAGVHVKDRNADCLLSMTHDPRIHDPPHLWFSLFTLPPPLSVAVVAALDLFLDGAFVCTPVTPVPSVPGTCRAEGRRGRFYFIEVLLFSFFIVYLPSSHSSNLSSDNDWSRNV